MPRASFHDENRHRRYPFVSTREIELAAVDNQIPDTVLLDAGFSLVAYSGFLPDQHRVWLDVVSYDGSTVSLSFATNAPEAAESPLVFVLNRVAVESQLVFAESSAPSGPCETPQLLWYGFVTAGSLEDLVAWLGTSPVTLDADQHTIEPTLLQNLDGTYVRSVSLANKQRVRTTDIPGVPRPIIVNASCLQGPIRFVEGFNARVSYDNTRNGLLISAAVGSGSGQTCDEVPQFDGETSPDGGELLSGGPTCNQVIKTINGVEGPLVQLRGGTGIRIERDTDTASRLVIAMDHGALNTCPGGGE